MKRYQAYVKRTKAYNAKVDPVMRGGIMSYAYWAASKSKRRAMEND